jgi:catechol 2,3-dioxygenase-like lactoylglutathione lyase family enzyme
MSELDTLDHVAIQVEDVARAVAWYRETFSVDVTYQDETWALLAFANVRLALVVPGQHPPHLAVVRPDAASFGPLKPHRDGTASVYTHDSEGNVLEIMAPYA